MTFHSIRHRRLAQATRREMLSATTCRPGSRCRSPPSSSSGLSPWPTGWASPPPPSCAGPSPPTSPSSRRSTPNPMENAMTSSTHSKKSNGLQGDLLSGEWLSQPPQARQPANTYD